MLVYQNNNFPDTHLKSFMVSSGVWSWMEFLKFNICKPEIVNKPQLLTIDF